jgi:RNA polymerase sigma-70 factor (ECF subfamily)
MDRQEILKRLRERIFSFAASRLGRDLADDLAQEVLMVIHEKYAHLDSLEDLLPVALQTTRFKMMAVRRKQVRHGEHTAVPAEDLPLTDGRPTQADEFDRKQQVDRLARAIEALGERCRQMLQWKLAGKGFAEIQKLLDVESINTVYTWDHRCRKQLLELMGGSWEGAAPQEPSSAKGRLQ